MIPPGNTLEDLLREADAAARAGDLSEAERLYRRVLDRSPANVAAWLGLGTVLVEPGRKAECFAKVLAVDPGNAEAAASLERLRAVLPAAGEKLYCAFHPKAETVLRCSQCGRPICVRCVRPHAVGQLCPACVRGRVPLYYQPGTRQLFMAGLVSLAIAAFCGGIASYLTGWSFILSILGGLGAGSLIAQAALRVGERRRGWAVQLTVGLCIVVGSIIGGAGLFAVLWMPYGIGVAKGASFLLYVALAAGSAVAWLK